MFIFSDPVLLQSVIRAHKRGVKVRIMLNPVRRSGETENAESRKMLKAEHVEVIDSNPAFDVTHEKSMVVDDNTAFIQSLNWETKTRHLLTWRNLAKTNRQTFSSWRSIP